MHILCPHTYHSYSLLFSCTINIDIYDHFTRASWNGKGKHVTKHKKRKQTVYYFITYYISDQLKEIILQNNILLYIYISSLIKKKNIKSYTIKIQKIH